MSTLQARAHAVTVAAVIDLKNPYNWVAILVVMLVGGFVLRQIGNRVPIVKQMNTAAGQAA